jgi:hypothetical protein
MGSIWELEASLQEVISLLVPEANRSGNPLLKTYANQIAGITDQLKVWFFKLHLNLGKNDRVHWRN